MKIKSYIFVLGIVCMIPVICLARGYRINSSLKIHSYGIPKHPSYPRIHSVRPYVNRRGIYHSFHRSGNPYSGVHCRNNVCGVISEK